MSLEPLLYEYGVDLELWAHEHSYERLYPIYNYTVCNGSAQSPYKNPRAPVHVVTGSAVSTNPTLVEFIHSLSIQSNERVCWPYFLCCHLNVTLLSKQDHADPQYVKPLYYRDVRSGMIRLLRSPPGWLGNH